MSQVRTRIALRKCCEAVKYEPGQHLVRRGPGLVIERAHLAVTKMNFTKRRVARLAEAEPFASPGMYETVGELAPLIIRS